MNSTINYSGFIDLITQRPDATEDNQLESNLTHENKTAAINNTSRDNKDSDSASQKK